MAAAPTPGRKAAGRPARTLDLLRSQHLDRYNVEYGILLAQEYRPIPTLPDTDYANALARAYNDLDDRALDRSAMSASRAPAIIATQGTESWPPRKIRRIGPHDGNSRHPRPKRGTLPGTANGSTTRSSKPASNWICPSSSTPGSKGPA